MIFAAATLLVQVCLSESMDNYCNERALEKISCWFTYLDGREGCAAGQPIHQRKDCPPGLDLRFLGDVSNQLDCRQNYSFNYRARLPSTDDRSLISISKGYEIPHANIHVCHAATHLACTPFLANNNEDSSHSKVKQANFSSSGEAIFADSVAFSNFEAHGSKTILAHFRYFQAAGEPEYAYDAPCGDKNIHVVKIDVGTGTVPQL
jgi:hypothetical protein